jgi:hypothetical protein
MKLVSFLFSISWILPAVQSHEGGGNLRASQGQMQEHLQQELDQSLRNLNEEFQGDRELFFVSAGSICNRIEKAFQENVDCTCNWRYLNFAFEFKCTTNDRVNVVGGISGVPEYTGALDLNPFQLGLEIKANVCIKEGKFKDSNLQDICVGGALCIGLSGTGPCGCEASYGAEKCACTSCSGGVAFQCGEIPSLCIPLPFVRSFSPEPNSIEGLKALEAS